MSGVAWWCLGWSDSVWGSLVVPGEVWGGLLEAWWCLGWPGDVWGGLVVSGVAW